MNTFVSSIVAAERHQSFIDQADAHRRSNRRRPERRSRRTAARRGTDPVVG